MVTCPFSGILPVRRRSSPLTSASTLFAPGPPALLRLSGQNMGWCEIFDDDKSIALGHWRILCLRIRREREDRLAGKDAVDAPEFVDWSA